LPVAVRWRRDKQGFILPEARWLRNELAGVIRATFEKSVLADLGVLEPRAFLRYYEDFRAGKRVWYTDISRVFMAELWARRALGFSPPFTAGDRSPRKTADDRSRRLSVSAIEPG
jgi:asparagine synthase (glutamine-hydrolysing)